MRLIFLFFCAAMTLAPNGAAQAKTMIGPWEVSLRNACGISDKWKNEAQGTEVLGMAYIDKGKSLMLVFGDTRWKLKQDEDLRISLQVDDGWKQVVPGSALTTDKAAAFIIPVNSTAVNALMNGNELFMDIMGKGEEYSYAYRLDDDTTEALTALDACRFNTAAMPSDNADAASANKSASMLTITEAVLSINKEGQSPQTTFDQQTAKIFLNAQISGMPTNGVLRINWIAEKTREIAPNTSIGNLELKASSLAEGLNTWISRPPAGWPTGDLRVNLSVNNKPLKTVRFRIKPVSGPAFSKPIFSLNKGGRSPQTVFGTQAPKLYLTSNVLGVAGDALGRFDWIAVKTGKTAPNYKINSFEIKLSGNVKSVDVSLSKPNAGWPVGEYRVDMFIDNQLKRSAHFRIE